MTETATFQSQTAIVTGGSRGLGRSILQALAARKMRVVAVARGAASLEAVMAEYASQEASRLKLGLKLKNSETAMNLASRVAILLLLACMSCLAQTGKTGEGNDTPSPKLEKMPESLEARLALSALPPHLRDGATIYLLDPAKGYMVNRRGTNGFSCFVMRTEWMWPKFAFRDDIFVPMSYDEEGSAKMMPVWTDVAQMRARGLPPEQVYEEIMKRFGNGTYQKPARSGISYMIAPLMRSYPAPNATEVVTFSGPHYMFYAPNVKDADIGGKPFSPYPFLLPQGPGPHDVIILLVGEAEKAKILADSSDLLKELCTYRTYLCLNTGSSEHH